MLSNPSESSKLKENWTMNPMTVTRQRNQKELTGTQMDEEEDD